MLGQTKRYIGVGFKRHFKNITNQEEEKSPVTEHLLNLNYSMKTIKLFENVNNCKGLNRETIETYKKQFVKLELERVTKFIVRAR